MRYRPQISPYYYSILLTCLVLGWCSAHSPDDPVIPGVTAFQLGDAELNSYVWLSRIAAFYYFAYFLIVTPVLGLIEQPLPAPESISEPVLSHPARGPLETAV